MNQQLDIKKTVSVVIVLNIIQVGAALAIFGYILFTGRFSAPLVRFESGYFLLFVIVATSIINSIIAVRDVYHLVRAGAQHRILEETLTRLEDLNRTLRAQRHDFMNHLQVVFGLIEMDEYGDARDYIEKVYNDIQKVSRVLKTANPAVNALLQAKMLDCEKRGIMTCLAVTTQLNSLRIPSWEFCRILGNLIDNAMDALKDIEGERLIELELFEDLKCFGFRVRNNGPAISPGLFRKIFEPGFTTKGDKGRGMGLSIAFGIMTEYGGALTVQSSEGSTVFEGFVPKQEDTKPSGRYESESPGGGCEAGSPNGSCDAGSPGGRYEAESPGGING